MVYLDDAGAVHRDAVVGVTRELVERPGGGSVNYWIGGGEVLDEWFNRSLIAELYAVVAPAAAASYRLGQLTTQILISLQTTYSSTSFAFLLRNNQVKNEPIFNKIVIK